MTHSSTPADLAAYLRQSRLLQKAALTGAGTLAAITLPTVHSLGQCGNATYNDTGGAYGHGSLDINGDGTDDFDFYVITDEIFMTGQAAIGVWQIVTDGQIHSLDIYYAADVDGETLDASSMWQNGDSGFGSWFLDDDASSRPASEFHSTDPNAATNGYIGVRNTNTSTYGFMRVLLAADNGRFNAGAAAIDVDATMSGMDISSGSTAVGGDCLSLPIELVSFSAARDAGGEVVELTWATAQERGSTGFAVERRSDAGNFERVGYVQAAGDSDQALSYSFVDDAAPAGELYYRLRMLDLDGTAEHSPTVYVVAAPQRDEKQLEVLGSVRPGGSVNLRLRAGLASDWDLAVYSSAGDELYRQTLPVTRGTTVLELPVDGLTAGVYFVSAVAGDGERMFAKVTAQ